MDERDERRGEVMTTDKSLEERVADLERKVERLGIVLEFLTAFKVAVGHLWSWLDKNVRGQR